VDDADFDRVNMFKWSALKDGNTFYASRSEYKPRRRISMHAFILGFPISGEIDHKDRNGLNNTRDNLRLCTPSQNRANSPMNKRNTSGFKGVYFTLNKARPWNALIRSNRVRYRLGYFKTAEEAARAYDAKAKELNGEFAWLNFPETAGETST
jgi:hypothetical protein